MINPAYAILVVPAVAMVILAFVSNYRIGATLNVVAAGITCVAGVSLLFVEREIGRAHV